MGIETPLVGFVKSVLGSLLSIGGILLVCLGVYLLFTSDTDSIGGKISGYVLPFFLSSGGSVVALIASVYCCYKLSSAIYSIVMCICCVFCLLIVVGIAFLVISFKYPEMIEKWTPSLSMDRSALSKLPETDYQDTINKYGGRHLPVGASQKTPAYTGAAVAGGLFLSSGIFGLIVTAVILYALVSRQQSFLDENLAEWRARSLENLRLPGNEYQRKKNTKHSPPKQPRDGSPPKQPRDWSPSKQPPDWSPSKQPRNGSPPKQPHGVTPPKQPRDWSRSKQPRDWSPSKQPRGGSPPKQPRGVTRPKQPRDGSTPKQPRGGSTPKQPRGGNTPKQPRGGSPPKQPRGGNMGYQQTNYYQ